MFCNVPWVDDILKSVSSRVTSNVREKVLLQSYHKCEDEVVLYLSRSKILILLLLELRKKASKRRPNKGKTRASCDAIHDIKKVAGIEMPPAAARSLRPAQHRRTLRLYFSPLKPANQLLRAGMVLRQGL